MSAGGHGEGQGKDERGIVIVVVVVVVEQKPGIFPNKSGRPAATKVEEAQGGKRERGQQGQQGQATRGNPTHGPTGQPNAKYLPNYATAMTQGTSKLAEKQKKANKKTDKMKKGKRIIPPKKTLAIKQRQATKVRPRGGDEDRYSYLIHGGRAFPQRSHVQ